MKKIICFVFIMAISVFVYAETLVVNQFDGPYYTINEAYDNAVDDDVILIYPATYLESISISKSITIEGIDPSSTIIQTNSYFALKIDHENCSLKKLKIRCTNTGVEIRQSISTIENCIFEQSYTGIDVEHHQVNIKNCTFRNCNIGLDLYNTSGIVINNVIHDCFEKGIATGEYSGTCDVNIFSNVIMNSDYGIFHGGWTYIGDIANNCFYNNNINTHDVTLGLENIFDIDPLFTDYENGNYYLQSNSPCIDTGISGSQYEDIDGTRNDMGIFGGPTEWSLGKPTVLDVQINPESVLPGDTFDIEATGQIK